MNLPSMKRGVFEQFLQDNGLWAKESSPKGNRLTKALSLSLYFTDIYSDEIQQQILNYFSSQQVTNGLKFFSTNSVDDSEAFLTHPQHPKFESLNVEIFTILYKCRIKIIFLQETSSCIDIYNPKSSTQLKILRTADYNYIPVFPNQMKESTTVSRNIITDVCEIVSLENNKPQLIDFNKENFNNFSSLKFQKPNKINFNLSEEATDNGSKLEEAYPRLSLDNISKTSIHNTIKKVTNDKFITCFSENTFIEANSHNNFSSQNCSNFTPKRDGTLKEDGHFSILKPKKKSINFDHFPIFPLNNAEIIRENSQLCYLTNFDNILRKTQYTKNVFDDENSIWNVNLLAEYEKLQSESEYDCSNGSMTCSLTSRTTAKINDDFCAPSFEDKLLSKIFEIKDDDLSIDESKNENFAISTESGFKETSGYTLHALMRSSTEKLPLISIISEISPVHKRNKS